MGKQAGSGSERIPVSLNNKQKITKRQETGSRAFNSGAPILNQAVIYPSFDFASQDAFKHRESQHRESNFTTNCSRLSEIFDSQKKQNLLCNFTSFFDFEKMTANFSTKKIVNLTQIELTPNNKQIIGGITFSMKSTQDSSPSPISPITNFPKKSHKKGFLMKKINTFCDEDSNLTPRKTRNNAKLASPYITAYRKRLFKVKSDSGIESDISLSLPPIISTQIQNTCCSCRTSQCLKLYCECFKSLGVCGPNCHCTSCENRSENELVRNKAMERILASKYGKARFDSVHSQIQVDQITGESKQGSSVAVKKVEENGCQCRKSNCVNKYCGCHSQGQKCGLACNCLDCHNS